MAWAGSGVAVRRENSLFIFSLWEEKDSESGPGNITGDEFNERIRRLARPEHDLANGKKKEEMKFNFQ
eukprot:c23784_g1_i5 orf=146-349(+)